MKILTNWLRTYVPAIPADDQQLADDLTLRGIAVEGVHDLGPNNGHLFEMDITTNRVDAMNHYGIAREAATIYNLPLLPLLNNARHSERSAAESKNPRISPEATQTPTGRLKPFPIRIEAKDLCGRFTAQILRNVTIAPSTGLISEYFNLLGQKQISNAVDASNFVLMGMGHPTHAFDLDKLEGGIVVRLAHKGEKLKLLDGTERILEPDDLVVADEVKALALAGVMGGYDSMITPETKNILVEAAWFDPAAIRRSSRRHGLHTDASHRFERGADINAASIANALVSQLILQNGGQPEGDLIDVAIPEVAARTASRPAIQLSVQQVQRHLGTTLEDTPTHSALTPELIHQYLTALGCQLNLNQAKNPGAPRPALEDVGQSATNARVPHPSQSHREGWETKNADPPVLASRYPEAGGPGLQPWVSSGLSTPPSERDFSPWGMSSSIPDTTFQVQLPSWRLDLEREIDLIEEVARVYGYNRFANTLPTPGIVIAHPLAPKEAAIRNRLLALGFSESISSTFASQQDADLFYQAQNPGAPSSRPHLGAKVGIRAEHEPLSSTAAAIRGTIPLENPLSEEATLLRPSLIPGMVTMLHHNLNRDVKDVRLFEQGQIFTGTTEAVEESPSLTLGLTTANPQTIPPHMAQDVPFFELKGAIESLLSLFDLTSETQSKNLSSQTNSSAKEDLSSRPEAAHFAAAVERPVSPAISATTLTFTPEAPQWLQPGRSATALLNNEPIAHFGELSATESARRKLRQPIYLAQLDLARLYELPLKKVTAHDLSRFQAVERDFSFVFPDAVQWHTIAEAIHALAIPELQSLRPAEVWRDRKKYSGVYSLLVRAVFQSNDRTLRDEELTTWWSTIIATLTSLGGTIRA